ncbi:hypothetical protein RF11_16055 [Thelohanellus kitauei]|uniref:General transcription factor II-I repeat domain-containing protein 2 n=1 Tax=Thelohanellus kitauei TaxID=669202 RepID=A0A0C2MVK7_THEKT|nr:hypothetical protein RF11_16055 [Thelohanellus kitauei]
MAIDESNGISDTDIVEVFSQAINIHIGVIEELLGLEYLHSTTKGSDLLETLKSHGMKKPSNGENLVSIRIDGAPAMMGRKSQCLTLLEQFLNLTILIYHCIIHLEALWENIEFKKCQGCFCSMCQQNPQRCSEPARIQAVSIRHERGIRESTATL